MTTEIDEIIDVLEDYATGVEGVTLSTVKDKVREVLGAMSAPKPIVPPSSFGSIRKPFVPDLAQDYGAPVYGEPPLR